MTSTSLNPLSWPGLRWLRTRRPAMQARWRAWWQGRLSASDQQLLTQRNVYILPTKAGLMLCVTLMALLIGSINYQLNLGYLLTFLLAGCTAMALFVSHNNVRGLRVALRQLDEVYAGAAATVHVDLTNTTRRARYALAVHVMGGKQSDVVDVGADAIESVSLAIPWVQRGEHHLPLIVLESRFPMGAFRVWTVWRPASKQLVYPAPEANAPPLPPGEPRSGQGGQSQTQDWSEFDGVRSYRTGDPLKIVMWKKFAKNNELVSRDGQTGRQRQLWLDYSQCGTLDAESRLSRLTAWVLRADQLGVPYGLRLPGAELTPAQGAAHRLACLETLARW